MLSGAAVDDVPRALASALQVEGEQARRAGVGGVSSVRGGCGPEQLPRRIHAQPQNGPETVLAARDEVARLSFRRDADDLFFEEAPQVEVPSPRIPGDSLGNQVALGEPEGERAAARRRPARQPGGELAEGLELLQARKTRIAGQIEVVAERHGPLEPADGVGVASRARLGGGELEHEPAVIGRGGEHFLEPPDACGGGIRRGSGGGLGEKSGGDDRVGKRMGEAPRRPKDALLYEGRHLSLKQTGSWEFVERRGRAAGVMVIAVTPEGRLLLVEEDRPPLGGPVISLPAGLADGEGEAEDPARAAARELREETGYTADSFERLAGGPSSPGLSSETVSFYLARGVRRAGEPTGEEQITLHAVPVSEVPAWARAREQEGIGIHPLLWAGLYLWGRS